MPKKKTETPNQAITPLEMKDLDQVVAGGGVLKASTPTQAKKKEEDTGGSLLWYDGFTLGD